MPPQYGKPWLWYGFVLNTQYVLADIMVFIWMQEQTIFVPSGLLASM